METELNVTLQLVFFHSTVSLGFSIPSGVQGTQLMSFHRCIVDLNTSLATDIYLRFQFLAFIKNTAATTCEAAPPANPSERNFLGLVFLDCKTRGLDQTVHCDYTSSQSFMSFGAM